MTSTALAGARSRGARSILLQHRSAVIGAGLLVALVIVGITTISGFASFINLRSLLVFASFLGIAAIGQTLCALIGGMDLSIPFVIGSANILLLRMIGWGVPVAAAILVVIVMGAVTGIANGAVSYRQHGGAQSLVVSLGMGTALIGLVQILVSRGGTAGIAGGTITGQVPDWLQTAVAVRSPVGLAPSVYFWALLSIATIVLLRRAWLGRGIYALGGNRVAAKRALVPELGIWTLVFGVSGATAACTGVLLLGFSGGGYADVGQPYLFMTLAAVVIGGTSLIGGRGGYPLTILGVLILTVLQQVLVGFGLSSPAQQAILGLIIIPMVALYARQPHPRMQI